ncbi:BofC C-terminal domain-containing protein [Thalassobacillus sp. CUG 92003]|uniref:BofC C-terminal domain-containing protein n=1 Tax=Thalassobacillus sp. CUG 92003 TaxID=2736641 RepID=UPI0015E687ED|nr:BofC C-terminal domain-containing protein [Thalassobacillus sp. CUG 92003]
MKYAVLLCLSVLVLAALFTDGRQVASEAEQPETEKAEPSRVKKDPLQLTVILKTEYIDGVTERQEEVETIWSMADFWAEYEGWTVSDQSLDTIVFVKQANEISPLTEQNGYFGLNSEGDLAVFNGKPAQGNVIESFQPIPVKQLESLKLNQLQEGIKIKDAHHFRQVTKTYRASSGAY